MEIIQVSDSSPTSAVARAIESVVHEYHCAEVQAIGPEAAQRAEQALTEATAYLQDEGICVDCVPQRKEVILANKPVTLIKVMVKVTTTSSPSPHFFPAASSNPPSHAEDLPRA